MLGWLSRATVCESFRNAVRHVAFDATAGGSRLRATGRASGTWRARYTIPMPPRPSSRSSEYSPASASWSAMKSESGAAAMGQARAAASPYARFHGMAPPPADQQPTYFRKGFGLKADVQAELTSYYNGHIVAVLRKQDHALTVEAVTIRLAQEVGFCYGVERAVEYAYQTRRKFPDRRRLLVGETIHNPHVAATLRGMGVTILERGEPGFDFSGMGPAGGVILPAFGVTT